jgi:hypothetical protein
MKTPFLALAISLAINLVYTELSNSAVLQRHMCTQKCQAPLKLKLATDFTTLSSHPATIYLQTMSNSKLC